MRAEESPASPSEDPDPPTVGKVLMLTSAIVTGLLTVLIVGFQLKDWLFGRNLRYEFWRLPSSQLKRSDFEEEFTRRVTAKGYEVFYFRVGYEHPDHTYDAEITLYKVPSSISGRETSEALRQVIASFTREKLTVEQVGPTMAPKAEPEP